MSEFLQLTVNGIVVGSIYALVAIGFVLIYKASSIINFAQGEFLMMGAYICLALSVQFRIPFVAAFFITLVFSSVLGLLVERVVLRPMIGEPIISVIMVTIGLASILRGIVQVIWGTQNRVYPEVFSEEPIYLGHIPISEVYLWSLFLCFVILVVLSLFFKYTRQGIAMRAAADDQQATLSVGISVKRVFAQSWVLAAVVSAIGGILLGTINGINSTLSFIGLKVFPVVILGGLDSIGGAILGGLAIGVVENLSGGYLEGLFGGGVKEVAPFVVLVLTLMIKPYGLFGKEEIERV